MEMEEITFGPDTAYGTVEKLDCTNVDNRCAAICFRLKTSKMVFNVLWQSLDTVQEQNMVILRVASTTDKNYSKIVSSKDVQLVESLKEFITSGAIPSQIKLLEKSVAEARRNKSH